jgi:hypothetical protein
MQISALLVTELAQLLFEGASTRQRARRYDHAKAKGLYWLPSRFGREARRQPCTESEAEDRPALEPLGHSITSSASARIDGGRERPRAPAVFRLTINLKCVGCSIGSSPGEAPRKMRTT